MSSPRIPESFLPNWSSANTTPWSSAMCSSPRPRWSDGNEHSWFLCALSLSFSPFSSNPARFRWWLLGIMKENSYNWFRQGFRVATGCRGGACYIMRLPLRVLALMLPVVATSALGFVTSGLIKCKTVRIFPFSSVSWCTREWEWERETHISTLPVPIFLVCDCYNPLSYFLSCQCCDYHDHSMSKTMSISQFFCCK